MLTKAKIPHLTQAEFNEILLRLEQFGLLEFTTESHLAHAKMKIYFEEISSAYEDYELFKLYEDMLLRCQDKEDDKAKQAK